VRGVAAGLSDVIYISGEVGVGGGIIIGGRPLLGAGGYGGEIGHMCVNPKGRLCRCGRRGCWETEIGEEAVLLATGRPEGTELADVIAAHRAGERRAVRGMHRVGEWLGLGVVNLVNVFNPEMIVFGGMTRDIFEATEPVVTAALGAALAAPREQVRLEPAALRADSTVIGAAELAFGPLLANPTAAFAGGPIRLNA
jgi:predicted NBD/HSP70 family sugar kinase